MKWLETYRLGKQRQTTHEQDEIAFRRPWMDAASRSAATEAVRALLANRTLNDYKKAIKVAEKSQNKYLTLAELLLEVRK